MVPPILLTLRFSLSLTSWAQRLAAGIGRDAFETETHAAGLHSRLPTHGGDCPARRPPWHHHAEAHAGVAVNHGSTPLRDAAVAEGFITAEPPATPPWKSARDISCMVR